MQLVGANSERLHRASHRLVGEPSRLTDAFAEPDDARERINDAEAATGGACNEQPAVVGAEIEGPVDRVIAASRLPGWWRSGVPLPSAKWLPTPDWERSRPAGRSRASDRDCCCSEIQPRPAPVLQGRSCRVGPAARRHPERQDLNFQASNHFSRTWYDSGLPQKQPCSSGS